MELFLGVAAIIFLIFGALLLLAPKIVEKLIEITSKILLTIGNENLFSRRRLLGVLLLALSIVCWYIALYKGLYR